MIDYSFKRYEKREDYLFLEQVQKLAAQEFYSHAHNQFNQGYDPEAIARGMVACIMSCVDYLQDPRTASNMSRFMVSEVKSAQDAVKKRYSEHGHNPIAVLSGIAADFLVEEEHKLGSSRICYILRDDLPFLKATENAMHSKFYAFAQDQIEAGRELEAVFRGLFKACILLTKDMPPTPEMNTLSHINSQLCLAYLSLHHGCKSREQISEDHRREGQLEGLRWGLLSVFRRASSDL